MRRCASGAYICALKRDKTFEEGRNTRSVIFLRSTKLKIETKIGAKIRNNSTIFLYYYILFYLLISIFIWLLYFYLWFETRDSSNIYPYISSFFSALSRFQKSGWNVRIIGPWISGCSAIFSTRAATEITRRPNFLTVYDRPGCRVGERVYVEGEMVRDIEWKAACDNCFCAMGAIRCVPLACAPPLQGCSPIVREGQCCPSTYNCSEFHANSHSRLSHAHHPAQQFTPGLCFPLN